MKTLDLYLNEQLKNEEFRKEWEENQPEMDIIRAMADARISQNLTQKELAERTGSATLEIASMIQAIQQEMHAASQGMHTALGRISSGVAHSEDTAESIAGIHDTMSNMVTRIRDIARATEEQSAASQDISNHIEHINQMSQHTDQQISEASAETQRLRQLGQQLDALVQRFRT